jgi:HAD superfamily hydrolase (TIGR01509 family)
MPLEACFLDVDGVITDFAHLDEQWDRYIGEVLAPELGLTAEDWGRANRIVFPQIWAHQEEWGTDPGVRMRREGIEIIGGMCAHLDVALPSEDRCDELMRAVEVHVARRGSAVFPGARAAIRALASRWALHTATGNPSRRVEAYFEGMGTRALLGVPAGPDLVGIWKAAPEFYERLFALAGVDPGNAVVVDDSAGQLELAASRGAHTILVDARGDEDATGFDATVRVIDDVPAAVEEVAGRI